MKNLFLALLGLFVAIVVGFGVGGRLTWKSLQEPNMNKAWWLLLAGVVVMAACIISAIMWGVFMLQPDYY